MKKGRSRKKLNFFSTFLLSSVIVRHYLFSLKKKTGSMERMWVKDSNKSPLHSTIDKLAVRNSLLIYIWSPMARVQSARVILFFEWGTVVFWLVIWLISTTECVCKTTHKYSPMLQHDGSRSTLRQTQVAWLDWYWRRRNVHAHHVCSYMFVKKQIILVGSSRSSTKQCTLI